LVPYSGGVTGKGGRKGASISTVPYKSKSRYKGERGQVKKTAQPNAGKRGNGGRVCESPDEVGRQGGGRGHARKKGKGGKTKHIPRKWVLFAQKTNKDEVKNESDRLFIGPQKNGKNVTPATEKKGVWSREEGENDEPINEVRFLAKGKVF